MKLRPSRMVAPSRRRREDLIARVNGIEVTAPMLDGAIVVLTDDGNHVNSSENNWYHTLTPKQTKALGLALIEAACIVDEREVAIARALKEHGSTSDRRRRRMAKLRKKR